MPRKKSPTVQLEELKAENEALRLELARVKKTASQQTAVTSQPNKGPIWKRIAVLLSAIIATTLLVAGNILFWAGNSVVDGQRFSVLTSPLMNEPEVQTAIAQYTTTRLFERVDVEQLITDALPPRADFVAPAVASQLRTATQNTLTRVMQNPSFQETWNSALTRLHDRFITFVETYQGDGTLQLADVYNKLIARLADTKLNFLSKVSLPENIGSITLVNATWLPAAHNIVTNIALYQALTTSLFVIFTALTIWLAARRRRVAIIMGILFAVFMLLTLVAIRITQGIAIDQVASEYQDAIRVVSDIVLDTLIIQTRALLLVGLMISLVAWISGPYKGAVLIRSRIQALFGGNIHQAIIGTHDNAFTHWLGDHKKVLQWLFVATAAIVVIIIQITPVSLFWIAVGLVLALLILEIVAAPTKQRK